jgi:hypothetical protein
VSLKLFTLSLCRLRNSYCISARDAVADLILDRSRTTDTCTIELREFEWGKLLM